MIRIIICDDDRSWQRRAAEIVSAFADQRGLDAEVKTCGAPDQISGCFDDSEGPDVIFMDIEFDERDGSVPEGSGSERTAGSAGSGIDAAREINRVYPDCRIVYLTNHLSYALDVYDTEHIWFVTKGQLEDRLPEVFEKILRMAEDKSAELIIRDRSGKQTRVECAGIRYLERRDRRTVIRTDDGDFTVQQRIPEIESKLPDGMFGRCHTSYIVNMAKVRSIGDRSLRMDDGTEILISRGYGKSFRLRYMEWAGSRAVR